MKCPHCDTEATKVGAFWVCPQHGQLPEPKPAAPLRIFLSYGHDTNEELVRRIKADLEKGGHDVWFDKSEIKFGDDWRRSITDGIANSHKFVSFLSKHSTRDPGVCLDEIGIAIGVKKGNIQTILVESESEVKPPPGIGHTQWLDMHDWKERRTAGEAAWEEWYNSKFEEIKRVVESDESRRFAGEIEKLQGYLKPIESDSRIYELLKKGLTGRQWIFDAIEQWRTRSESRLQAAPGFGVPASAGSESPLGVPPLGGSAAQPPKGGTPNPDRVNAELQTPSPLGGERAGVRGDSRLFWLMGAPGVGKSAIAAHLAIHGREVIAVEFCNWQQPGHRHPEQIIRTLAFQIATRLPDYRKLLLTLPDIAALDRKNAAELFDYLLADPLHHAIDGGRERHLIVIDALDEAGDAGRNPLVELLARHAPRLPDWIGLVVTSRPESNVIAPLQGLNPFPFETSSAKNLADIRDHLRHELAAPLQGRADADRLLAQILEKSEGVFLYVERFCDDLRCGHLSLDRPEQFPQGLGRIFHQWFHRQFPDLEKFRHDVRPALRAILAAREPLPVEILQCLFHWQDEELRDFTRSLGSLFTVTKEQNGEVIKPCHKSLADWLTDEAKAGAYFVSAREGHRMLATLGFGELQKDSGKLNPYFATSLLGHLSAAEMWQELFGCLGSNDSLRKLWPGLGESMYYGSRLNWRELIQNLPANQRRETAWGVAESFAAHAAVMIAEINKFKSPWNQTGDALRGTDDAGFAHFRDTFYSFIYLAGAAASAALVAWGEDHGDKTTLSDYLRRWDTVRALLWYLLNFGSGQTGLSGKLEDDACVLYDAWQEAMKKAEPKHP